MIEKDHTVSSNSQSMTFNNSGIKGNDFIKLCQMLCIDYPPTILQGILKMLDKKEEENVDFDEFLNGVKTVMLYDNYFEEMESLFKYLDSKKQGKIKKVDLISSIAKLGEAVDKANGLLDATPDEIQRLGGKCELKVPNEDDLDNVYQAMPVEEDGVLNYDEYLILLFKVTQEGLE